MDKHNERIASYWQAFQDSLPTDSPYRGRDFTAEGWGDSPEMADELGALIAQGIKTGTCSAVWEWQAEGQDWPTPGTLTVVLDGNDEPLCIVETVEVTLCNFDQVAPDFAYAEGEGDRSLAYWQQAHQSFFSRSLQKIGREFREDMPLVCERFTRIFP